MVDEIRIETSSLKLDNRARIYIGKRNITRQVQRLAIIMGRDQLTEVVLVMKVTGKMKVKTRAVNSKSILDKFVAKVTSGLDERKTESDTKKT